MFSVGERSIGRLADGLLLSKAAIFGKSRNFQGIAPNPVGEWEDGNRVWGSMSSMITVV